MALRADYIVAGEALPVSGAAGLLAVALALGLAGLAEFLLTRAQNR